MSPTATDFHFETSDIKVMCWDQYFFYKQPWMHTYTGFYFKDTNHHHCNNEFLYSKFIATEL
jgi:hypothetical protein